MKLIPRKTHNLIIIMLVSFIRFQSDFEIPKANKKNVVGLFGNLSPLHPFFPESESVESIPLAGD